MSEYETGEPPRNKWTRPMYAEHMNVLAQHGDSAEPEGVAVRYSLHRRRLAEPLTDDERALAEHIWAQLPDWNELTKEHT